jgi:hypothetical protein
LEKVIYALWHFGDDSIDAFNCALLTKLPHRLLSAGAQNVRLNVQDAAVKAGAGIRQKWKQPQPDAILQFWLPSNYHAYRKPFDDIVQDYCHRLAAWTVAESEILSPPPSLCGSDGARAPGWAQIALIAKPDQMSHADWISKWQDSHTQVAVDTQSNFAYIQNAVVRSLTADAPEYLAIVEECFPLEAMTDHQLFFDAQNDTEKFQHNLGLMMASCAQFIADGKIDVFATSQYNFRA